MEGRSGFPNQSCNRVFKLGAEHFHVYRLCAGGLELSFGLLDLHLGSKSSVKPRRNQFQGLLILSNGRVQKLLLSIKRAGLEIKYSQLGMYAQVHGRQVGSAGLRLPAIRLDVAAHSSPDVDLVGQFKRQLKVAEGYAIECSALGRTVRGRLVAGCRRTCDHGRIVVRPRIAEQGTSLRVLRSRELQVLVGDVDLFLKSVQLRVLKHLPPVAAEILHVWLSRFPIADFFVCRRYGSRRAMIVRSNRTAAKDERSEREKERDPSRLPRATDEDRPLRAVHFESPGNVA